MSRIRTGGRHHRSFATLALVLTTIVAACGGAAPTPAPTVAPTPLVTPDPHLTDPATARDVFNALGRAGLRMTPNTAAAGGEGDAVVSRIHATYQDWPLDVYEFRTSADLAEATAGWAEDDGPPGQGDPPVAIAGLNILVTWGPRVTGRAPEAPGPGQAAGVDALVQALEALLSPLRARAIVPIKLASLPAEPRSSDAPDGPEATPAP